MSFLVSALKGLSSVSPLITQGQISDFKKLILMVPQESFSTLYGEKVDKSRVKKHHSTLEMDAFKVMLLLSYLAHDFKCPLLDIEITIFYHTFPEE